MIFINRLIYGVILFLVIVSRAQAVPSWQTVNPLLQNDGLNSIAQGKGSYVAVGDRGLLFSSPDGLIWTQRSISNTNITSNLNSVAFAPSIIPTDGVSQILRVQPGTAVSLFVVVAESGEVLISLNAKDWFYLDTFGFAIHSILWNDIRKEFLFVGAGGQIFSSPDVGNWSRHLVVPVSSDLRSVIWDATHKRYLAVGDGGVILSSDKAGIWKRESRGIAPITARYVDVTFNPVRDEYLVLIEDGVILHSTANPNDADYKFWASNTGLSSFAGSDFFYSVSVNPNSGLYVITGDAGTIMTSSDPIAFQRGIDNWTQQNSKASETLNFIFWDVSQTPPRFMVAGQNSRILTSPDGVEWFVGTSWVNATLNKLIYDDVNALYLAVGSGETILSSPDSIDWNVLQTNRTATLHSVAFNPAAVAGQVRYVAVGTGGLIKSSADSASAASWGVQSSGVTTEDLFAVIWNADTSQYVAVGNAGVVLTSADGTTWQVESTGLPVTTNLRDLVWDSGNQRYVAVGTAGDVFLGSLDTTSGVLNWLSAQNSSTTNDLFAVIWDAVNSRYVASGIAGTLITSADGSLWASQTSGVTVPLRDIIWNKGIPTDVDNANNAVYLAQPTYMSVGDSGTVLTSPDAITWTPLTNLNGRSLSTVMWDIGRQQYIAAGELGTILRHDVKRPVIALNPFVPGGPVNPITIPQGLAFNDPGGVVTDNIDTGLTVTPDIQLDIEPVGTVTVTYTVTDVSGNAAVPVRRDVNITDQTPPKIVLNNNRVPFFAPVNLPFDDPGVTISDNVDTLTNLSPNLVVTGSVNTQALGTYALSYDLVDSVGNPAVQVVRTVEVVKDTTPPVISVIGNSHVSVLLGTRYTDLGATANDAVDGDITAKISTDNPVLNVNATEQAAKETALTVGTFEIVYTITDRSGNTARAIRTVTVNPIVKERISSSQGGSMSIIFLLCLLFLLMLRLCFLDIYRGSLKFL